MIVVSHRGPYRFSRRDDGSFEAKRGAGGVVTALSPLLAEREGSATWVAASMSPDDFDAQEAGATKDLGLTLRLVDLDPDVHRLHYDVLSNGILWFLVHGMFDHVRRPRFDIHVRDAWDAYVAVNEKIAEATAQGAADGDIVLVQDYQLALVPEFLRARRPDLRVTHFMHTPFCDPQDARVLPADIAERLMRSLAAGPQGFHTRRWGQAYEQTAADVLGTGAHIRAPFAASLGPDVSALEETGSTRHALDCGAQLADRVGERLVILRADRIEPSKNIVRGFLAYDRLLEARPGLRGRVVFVAMLYASREGLPEYLAYANEVEQAVARVNERWGTRDWTPIILDADDDFARSVAGMQRYDVLFVNPVRDGLNLVAKEGPALNRRDGVLCLSREAGAFEELGDASFELHPFDIEQMAATLDDALAFPLDDRATMSKQLRDLAVARTPAKWFADLVAHARDE